MRACNLGRISGVSLLLFKVGCECTTIIVSEYVPDW
jgi:hypothetical protein